LWEDDGSIYIGKIKGGIPSEGKKYVLQKDKTHTLFHVKFDEDDGYTEIEKKEISSGHKMV
jgi:hypothetical protein